MHHVIELYELLGIKGDFKLWNQSQTHKDNGECEWSDQRVTWRIDFESAETYEREWRTLEKSSKVWGSDEWWIVWEAWQCQRLHWVLAKGHWREEPRIVRVHYGHGKGFEREWRAEKEVWNRERETWDQSIGVGSHDRRHSEGER